MSHADIPAVVKLQVAFLEGSIVTELGAGFLTRFHSLAVTHESSRAFVARHGGNLFGFALGTIDVHAFNRFMKPRVLGALIRSVLTPSRIALVSSLARMMAEGEPQPPLPAELLLLVV